MRNSPVLRHSTLLRRTSTLAATAAAALVLAGCGSDEPSKAEDPAASSTSAAPTPSTPAEPADTPTSASSAAATDTPAGDVLITLDTPADGTTVSGSFDVKGTANSPEANVPWRILDGSGAKVLDGYFTAEGWMDRLYPYAGTVDVSSLAPGGYTFEVSIDDPSGGEGKPVQKVTRSITVQ